MHDSRYYLDSDSGTDSRKIQKSDSSSDSSKKSCDSIPIPAPKPWFRFQFRPNSPIPVPIPGRTFWFSWFRFQQKPQWFRNRVRFQIPFPESESCITGLKQVWLLTIKGICDSDLFPPVSSMSANTQIIWLQFNLAKILPSLNSLTFPVA